eukprot:TRINITY_DN32668_c0_g1_i1.p1 TRINITY_DN32668_c0_g1~~TRINITY_DN32668_c0_g1_i1.p1  ORF type:complete len:570 (+),score=91.32 TRINITY_DN32668_c0_g1_i1:43-1710(+)
MTQQNTTAGSTVHLSGQDDATWVLTSSFIILTMQSGFGLLESGYVPDRFGVNVMMKNIIDVVFGGLSYWLMGYGLSHGATFHGIVGTDKFALNAETLDSMVGPGGGSGTVDMFSHFIFQFAFAATATTIVSGAVAGRMRFMAYVVFSFLNTFIFSLPAHWTFNCQGWLYEMGLVDFAGDGAVHLLGGTSALVGAWLLGPREGRFDPARQAEFEPQSPSNCIFGLFLLWWGWLGFNCGSTFGISGIKWLVASRVAVTTVNASIGGGVFGVVMSYATNGLVTVDDLVNGILAALVAITGPCASVSPLAAFFIGAIGAALCKLGNKVLLQCQIDDPVGATGVHFLAAVWGLLCAGFFADGSLVGGPSRNGLLHGGGFALLGIQALSTCSIILWSTFTSYFTFKVIDATIGLRASSKDEAMGFDLSEHGVGLGGSGLSNAEGGNSSSINMEDVLVKLNLLQRDVVQLLQKDRTSVSAQACIDDGILEEGSVEAFERPVMLGHRLFGSKPSITPSCPVEDREPTPSVMATPPSRHVEDRDSTPSIVAASPSYHVEDREPE